MTNPSSAISKNATVRTAVRRNHAFIVMSFGGPVAQSYYEEAISVALKDAGFGWERADESQFTGRITERIEEGIKQSSIVIVDLTDDRPNCYFEAGYALALGKPIIFQKLDDPRRRTEMHFDVREHNHILYGTVADLREKLFKRLVALKAA